MQVRENIEDFKKEGFLLEKNHSDIINELEEAISASGKDTKENMKQLKGTLKILDQLKNG